MPFSSAIIYASSALMQMEIERARAENQIREMEYRIGIEKLYGLQKLNYRGQKPESKADTNCTQCGAKSFRLTSNHGEWKHVCSYCGSDK